MGGNNGLKGLWVPGHLCLTRRYLLPLSLIPLISGSLLANLALRLPSPISPSKQDLLPPLVATWNSSHQNFLLSLPIPGVPGDPTLSGYNEAGHAVGHTGSGSQEGDPHDDIRDP